MLPHAGMEHIEALHLALAAMPGTRAGSPYKFELVFDFRRRRTVPGQFQK